MAEQSHRNVAAVDHGSLSQQLAAGVPDQANTRFLRGILFLLIGLTIATGSVATGVVNKVGQTDTSRALFARD